MSPTPVRIEVDLRANTLRIHFAEPLAAPAIDVSSATIDVGARGRLLGVEIGRDYVSISPEDDSGDVHVRSATIPVRFPNDRVVELPRRYEACEISFPSGNACWRTGQGATLCSILVSPGATIAGERG